MLVFVVLSAPTFLILLQPKMLQFQYFLHFLPLYLYCSNLLRHLSLLSLPLPLSSSHLSYIGLHAIPGSWMNSCPYYSYVLRVSDSGEKFQVYFSFFFSFHRRCYATSDSRLMDPGLIIPFVFISLLNSYS